MKINFTKSFEGEFECAEYLPAVPSTAEDYVKFIFNSFLLLLLSRVFTVAIFNFIFVCSSPK
jgi:hypothetical protein